MPVAVVLVVAAAETAIIVASAASVPCRLRAVSAPVAVAVAVPEIVAEEAAADRHQEIEAAPSDTAVAAVAVAAVQAGGEDLSSSSSSAARPAEAAVEIPQGVEPAQVMPALADAPEEEDAIRHLAARGRFRPAHKLEPEVAADRDRRDKCIRIRPSSSSSSSSSRVDDLEVPVPVPVPPKPIMTITKGKEIETQPSIARSASRVDAEEGEGVAEVWAVAAGLPGRVVEEAPREAPRRWPKSTSASNARWTNKGR